MFADEKDVKATEPEAKAAAEETPAKKAPAKKPTAKKPAAKKDDAAEKKAPAKKATAKKPAAKKDDAEKTEAKADEAAEKKAPAKKAPAKKPAAKKAAPKEPVNVEPTFVRATARYVRSSPRKSRLVVDHIRDSSVEDARIFLQFTARHVGRDVAKVLESAVANAEHNHELDVDNLHIVKAFVDEGPTLKRWRPRAKGRATQILKRTSHITVVVSDVPAKELKKMSELKKTRKVVA
ncbi:MAG: 50S ribosomal protein L22 [Solirubrobacterales bacterium]|nr:50S ribosomal protein L22 [Solirubrobacterales bacterium]